MQNPLGKKPSLSTAKVFERKVLLKETKEFQLLKLIYTIEEETCFKEHTEVLLNTKAILL
jgi:hypothetical protein